MSYITFETTNIFFSIVKKFYFFYVLLFFATFLSIVYSQGHISTTTYAAIACGTAGAGGTCQQGTTCSSGTVAEGAGGVNSVGQNTFGICGSAFGTQPGICCKPVTNTCSNPQDTCVPSGTCSTAPKGVLLTTCGTGKVCCPPTTTPTTKWPDGSKCGNGGLGVCKPQNQCSTTGGNAGSGADPNCASGYCCQSGWPNGAKCGSNGTGTCELQSQCKTSTGNAGSTTDPSCSSGYCCQGGWPNGAKCGNGGVGTCQQSTAQCATGTTGTNDASCSGGICCYPKTTNACAQDGGVCMTACGGNFPQKDTNTKANAYCANPGGSVTTTSMCCLGKPKVSLQCGPNGTGTCYKNVCPPVGLVAAGTTTDGGYCNRSGGVYPGIGICCIPGKSSAGVSVVIGSCTKQSNNYSCTATIANNTTAAIPWSVPAQTGLTIKTSTGQLAAGKSITISPTISLSCPFNFIVNANNQKFSLSWSNCNSGTNTFYSCQFNSSTGKTLCLADTTCKQGTSGCYQNDNTCKNTCASSTQQGTNTLTNNYVANITATSTNATGTTYLASNVLAAQAIVITDNIALIDPTTNTFSNPSFKLSNLPPEQYNLYIHVNGYLDKQLTQNNNTVFTISSGQTTIAVGPVQLTPGDIAPQPNGDNTIDLQDYNAVLGCFGQKINTASCINPKAADLNHDGVVDQKDVDIIKANVGKHGDSPTITTPARTNPTISQGNNQQGTGDSSANSQTFTCVTDPICAANAKSIQLCPLKCSPK